MGESWGRRVWDRAGVGGCGRAGVGGCGRELG